MDEDHGGDQVATTDPVVPPTELGLPPVAPSPAEPWRAAFADAVSRAPSRRRRAVVATVTALAVTGAGVGAGLVAQQVRSEPDAEARPTSTSTSAQVDTASPAEIKPLSDLLARRSVAVTKHDRAAFLADLDPQAPGFRASQIQLYNNLVALPLSRWTYTVLPQGEFSRPDLATKYGAPIRAQAVMLRYALKGFDRGEVARALIYTFVKRDGAWRLGGDADLDSLLPPGGHAEPWDVQPISVVRGKSSIVIGARAQTAELRKEAALVDRAVGKVAKMWPSGWSRHVVVITASDQRVIKTYFRGESLAQLPQTAAIHVPTFGNLFGWYGSGFPVSGPTGDRIIFNPKARIAPDDLIFVLTHEVTHQATRPLQGGAEPTWLVEGIAEYTAYREFRLRGLDLPPALRADLKNGIDFLPTNTTFYSRDADDNYVESWLACAYIADRYGEKTLRRFFTRLAANADDAAVSEAEDAAFRSTVKTDRAAFLQGLTAYVRKVSS